LFDKFNIEGEIESLFRRRVDLPSGGYLIIEQTEALVSIDVNTGSYTGRKDHEKTILHTNLDAAPEIGRQLRLRDVGGIIVIDFIDMDVQANRDKVLQELRHVLSRDRARTRAFEVSELGLIEMTRQRVRPSLYDSMTGVCPDCGGAGSVFRPQVVARQVERTLRRVAREQKERAVTVRVHPEVALYLLEEEPTFLKEIRKGNRLDVNIRDNPVLPLDDFRIISEPAGREVTKEYEVV
jgi:ribonuclease G